MASPDTPMSDSSAAQPNAEPVAAAQMSRERLPRGIRVLVGAAFIVAIGYGIVAPVLPQYAHSFNVSVMAATAIVSVFGITRLIFAPMSGGLVNWLGERPVYLVGLLIVAASTLATAFAGSYWHLILFRSFGGIGSTLFTVSATGMIVRMAPPTMRGRASSAYGGAFLVGAIVGPILGGFLGHFGLRMPFFVYAGSLILGVIVVWRLLPASEINRRTAHEDPSTQEKLTVRKALHDSAYRSSLVTAFANGWGNFGVRVALLPLFVASLLRTNGAVEAGIAMSIFATGNVLALYSTRRLSDRWGRRPLIISGLLLCGIMTALVGQGSTVHMVYILSFFAGMGGGVSNPAQQAAVGDIVAGYRGGTVLASVQMLADLGSIVGTLTAGAIADYLGYGWAFAITGIIVAVSSLAWIFARETLLPENRAR